MIEFVGLRYVPMERGGVKLRKQVNALQPGVDAVGNRNIDEAILAGERDGGLRAFARERKEARPLAAAHDDRKNVPNVDRRDFRPHTSAPVSTVMCVHDLSRAS